MDKHASLILMFKKYQWLIMFFFTNLYNIIQN